MVVLRSLNSVLGRKYQASGGLHRGSASWPQRISTTPRFPDPVAYFERIFGRLRFNAAGWAQVNCCFHTPDREPSLSLHRGGGFNCFACLAHGGDILEFEHLHTGRDRRAIAQGWGAWSGKPIFEPPRPAWVRPAPRPVIVRDHCREAQAYTEYFDAARLNFEAVKAEAHRLCDRGSAFIQSTARPRVAPDGRTRRERPTKTSSVSSGPASSMVSSLIPTSAFASTWSPPATRPTA